MVFNITDPIKIFLQLSPPQLTIILFVLLLAVLGGFVENAFLSNEYFCEYDEESNKAILWEQGEFEQCSDEYTFAFLEKFNITQQIIDSPDGSALINDSINELSVEYQSFLFDSIEPVSLPFGASSRLYRTIKSWQILFGNNLTASQIVDGFISPEDLACPLLYQCLEVETALELGLSADCSIDDLPNFDLFVQATSSRVGDFDDFEGTEGVFTIGCEAFDKDPDPQLRAFGFPLFDYRVWLFLIIVFGALGGYLWARHALHAQ
jgi:hypothetical protein